MTGVPSFEEYLASLSPFAPQAIAPEPEALALCQRTTAIVAGLSPLDRARLAQAVAGDPDIAPVLAATVGLSQERFKTWLQWRFQTTGWVTLARKRSSEIIDALDDDLGLLAALEGQSARQWTWADVLARVMSGRQQAGGWVQQGRDLEDAVEESVKALGVPYETRTRFIGKAGRTAPADFVIPSGSDALIAVAVKGFDSTGSKLTAATREIEEMVEIKTPEQYIFAVVDGQGWVRRRGDLRRIHELWSKRLIQGLYPRGQLDVFEKALERAAKRVEVL